MVSTDSSGSTVRARPNHYETLGLRPTASSEEIEQAFAREINLPRAFGGLAQVSVAYATLRDPAKRKAYDKSIGLRAEPAPPVQPSGVRFSGSAHFIGAAMVGPDGLRDGPSRPAPPHRRPEPLAEPRTAPFIAASLREPLRAPRATAAPPPPAEPQRPPEAQAKPRTEPQVLPDLTFPRVEQERLPEAEQGPIEWKRPAIIAGAFVLAAGLVGAWAGSVAGSDAEAEQVTVPLPKAKQTPAKTVQAAVPEAPDVQLQYQRPRRAVPAVRRVRHAPVAQEPELSAEEIAEMPAVDVGSRTSFTDAATEQAAAVAPAASTAAAASMSLPNNVIARTIHRIGYSCGRVASTSAVDGEAGVFKVTCTSGHTYRAAPVRGRYHFKRLSAQ